MGCGWEERYLLGLSVTHPPLTLATPKFICHGTPIHLYPQAWPVQPSLPGALPSTHLPWIKALPSGAVEGRSSPH